MCCRSCPYPPSVQASAAVPSGFLLFVVAWVVLIVVAFGFPFSAAYSTAAVAGFCLMPWALLGKGVQDLALASEGAPLQSSLLRSFTCPSSTA